MARNPDGWEAEFTTLATSVALLTAVRAHGLSLLTLLRDMAQVLTVQAPGEHCVILRGVGREAHVQPPNTKNMPPQRPCNLRYMVDHVPVPRSHLEPQPKLRFERRSICLAKILLMIHADQIIVLDTLSEGSSCEEPPPLFFIYKSRTLPHLTHHAFPR